MHIFLDFSMHSKKREKSGRGGFLLSPRIRRKSSVWMDFARGLGRISKVNCFITLPTQHYSFSDPSKRQNFGFMCTFICSRLTMVNSTVLHSKSQPFINITLYISSNVWLSFLSFSDITADKINWSSQRRVNDNQIWVSIQIQLSIVESINILCLHQTAAAVPSKQHGFKKVTIGIVPGVVSHWRNSIGSKKACFLFWFKKCILNAKLLVKK